MTNLEVGFAPRFGCALLTISDFDEADFSVADPESHPDEVVIAPEPPAASHHFNGIRGRSSASNGGNLNMNRPPANRPQPVPGPGRGQPVGNNNQAPQPQTPNSGFTRSNSGAGQAMRPPADTGPQSRPVPGPPTVAGRVLNQPSRNGPPSAPASPAPLNRFSDDADTAIPPQGGGFFSARAATMLPEGQATEGPPAPIPNHLPAFNLHAESPSIRKTPGIDHKTSKPLTRDLKHVPGSTQAITASPKPTNVVNPQLDAARRIGAPGGFSPMANRGSFKQPMKRPVDNAANANRTPLTDLPANGSIGADAGGDVKRQRING
jgi:DNA repair and recombination protein RAD52